MKNLLKIALLSIALLYGGIDAQAQWKEDKKKVRDNKGSFLQGYDGGKDVYFLFVVE